MRRRGCARIPSCNIVLRQGTFTGHEVLINEGAGGKECRKKARSAARRQGGKEARRQGGKECSKGAKVLATKVRGV